MSKSKKKTKKPAKKEAPKRPGKPAKPVKKQAKPAKAPPSDRRPAEKKRVPPAPVSSMPAMAITPPKAPPAPRRKSQDPAVPLKPPVVRVKHAIFGIGRLVRELPEGKIEVHFEKVGRKTLLSSFVEVLPPVLGQ